MKTPHAHRTIRWIIGGLSALFLSVIGASAQTEIAKWTFETSVPAGAPGAGVWYTNVAAESGSGTASGYHAGPATYSNPAGNGSLESFSANTWAVGDLYQFAVSTVGQQNLSVVFDQTSSSTGPGEFNFAYSVDGEIFTVVSGYTVTNGTWNTTTPLTNTTFSFDLSGIPALNNKSLVYFRLIAASTVSAGGGTVATAGTSRIDNFTVFANNPAPVAIDVQPQDTTANVWSSASLSVTASGPLPQYQWFKNGVPLSDDDDISGTTSSTLTFAKILHTNAGSYHVVVSNFVNSVTSAPATLTVQGFAIVAGRANGLAGSSVNNDFSIIDAQSAITSISATSGNQSLLADANISATTTVPNTSGFLTMGTTAGTSGVVLVTITASSASFTTNATFPLMTVPNSGVLLNDYLDYADGSLVPSSSQFWVNHGGTLGDLQVIGGAMYLSRVATEDVHANLINAPHAVNSGKTLYSKFTVNFSPSDTPTSTGSYLAHFKDEAFGFRGRVWVSTNASGAFRLGIGNSSDATKSSGEYPLDIQPGTVYTVVTRLVLSNNLSTIWINPTSESDTSVTANDAVTNAVGVSSYAFRQNSGMSRLFVDDVMVGTSFAAVTGGEVPPEPIPLNVQRSGNNVILTWSDPSFALQAAPQVTGTYTNVPGATSPHTNAVSGSQTFFRLVK